MRDYIGRLRTLDNTRQFVDVVRASSKEEAQKKLEKIHQDSYVESVEVFE